MKTETAPGLPADWLNGWLAAVGIAVLLPDVRLSWTSDAKPVAVFHASWSSPLAERIVAALPNEAELEQSCLATLSRRVSLPAFRDAAKKSRATHDTTLAPSLTDLLSGKSFRDGDLPHGAFDPPMPAGVTLLQRVVTCRRLLAQDAQKRLVGTLAGAPLRERANGLGFDILRLPTGVQPDAAVMTDPAVECLCFAALTLFPVRGDGRRALQRGWTKPATMRGALTWPVWREPLEVWGVDALLDQFYAQPAESAQRLNGISGAFASVPFEGTGSSDPTRGYASERIA
ncbi:MAG: hypothetical protein AB7V19_04055 [Candidatus Bipolaricaulia bacterium]